MTEDLSYELTVVLLSVVLFITLFICTPINCYYALRFWKLRHKLFFKKRHPKYVLLTISVTLIWQVITRPISMSSVFLPDAKIFHIVNYIGFNLGYSAIVFMVVRAWLLFYDYQHAVALKSHKWKEMVHHSRSISRIHPQPHPQTPNVDNKDKVGADQMWTVKYKYFSKARFLIPFTIIYNVIIQTILITVFVLDEDTHHILFVTCLVVPNIIVTGFIISVRECRDVLCIKKEFYCLVIVLLPLIIPMAYFMPYLFQVPRLRLLVTTCLIGYISFALMFTTTNLPIYWYNQSHTKNRSIHNLSLMQVLENRDGFELFADHLVREFSIENLLFLFDIMHLKCVVLSGMSIERELIGKYHPISESFGVISVSDNDNQNQNQRTMNVEQFEQSAMRIIENYILRSAQFMINVSSGTRAQISSLIQIKRLHNNRSMFLMIPQLKLSASRNKNNPQTREMIEVQSVSDDEKSDTHLPSHSVSKSTNDEEIEKQEAVDEKYDNEDIDNNIEERVELSTDERSNIEHYFKLMDLAITEVIFLLSGDSFQRFKHTPEYIQFMQSLGLS